MAANFTDRLAAQQARAGTTALILAPRLLRMPLPMQRYDDPFFPFGKEIINATRDVICAYVFDLAAYLALGAAGAVALERTIGYVRAADDAITIMHAPFASGAFAEAAGDAAFAVDAVTVVDEQYLEAYTQSDTKAAFVVRKGDSPVIIPLPGNAGAYWEDVGLFTLLTPDMHTLNMQAVGDKVLYAGRGDDFGERVRAAVLAMRA